MMAEGMATLGPDKAAEVLRQWASLASSGAQQLKGAAWEAMQAFIGAAKPRLAAKESQMRELLDRSGARLAPIRDPLLTDFGLHRWLKGEREEAYSDWLAWTLQQIGSVADILNVLGIVNANVPTSALDVTANVTREVWVLPDGRPPARRLDLLVKCGETLLAVIEVKVVSPEDADLDKDKYYGQWARSQNPDAATILLALDGAKEVYDDFVLLTWERLCLNLRRLLPKLREQKGKGVVAAALTAAFVGAVEQNLLGFSDWPPDPAVSKHIRASLEP
jgi:hypothetical protein